MIEISVGDFVVVRSPYSWAVVNVASVTALQFKASGEWSSRLRTYRKADAVFSGNENAALHLADQLTSSTALHEDEKRKSAERRTARDANLIVKAQLSTALSSGESHHSAVLSES